MGGTDGCRMLRIRPFCTSPHHLLVWPPWAGLGAGHWEPLNQGRPHSALSFGLLASSSQTRTQQTSPGPSCEQLTSQLPFPSPSPLRNITRTPIASIASAAVLLCDRLGSSIPPPSTLPAPHARRPPIDSSQQQARRSDQTDTRCMS
jgi:hypothetical protein